MKVTMRTKVTGSLNGKAYPDRGKDFEVPDVVGAKLCEKGFAQPVGETAADRAEKAVPRKRAEKRG